MGSLWFHFPTTFFTLRGSHAHIILILEGFAVRAPIVYTVGLPPVLVVASFHLNWVRTSIFLVHVYALHLVRRLPHIYMVVRLP